MDELDLIITDKEFFRIKNNEIERFLKERKRLEDDVLEFKGDFNRTKSGKEVIIDFCKYIVAFSNSDSGGFIFYGIKDNIKNKRIDFPNYIKGLTIKDEDEILLKLQGWIKERIHRKVYVPIRIFDIAGRKILIVKIPPGTRKPYAYYDPSNKSYIYFKKRTGRIDMLKLEEIESLYYENLIESARKIQALTSSNKIKSSKLMKSRFEIHQKYVIPKLENIEDFGYWYLYCYPNKNVSIEETDLEKTFLNSTKKYSEPLNLSNQAETIQDGYSKGYFPTAVREDIKSTYRVTCYYDGFIALDSQVDMLFRNNKIVNLNALAYFIQRHLELCKEILKPYCKKINYWLNFDYIGDFSVQIGGLIGRENYTYQGIHNPIKGATKIAKIHGRDKWDIAIPEVIEIIKKIIRIFGLSSLPSDILDDKGIINYTKSPNR